MLWPPDGLNLKQGTCGEIWGYGYLPLPLLKPKATTAGQNVPTGGTQHRIIGENRLSWAIYEDGTSREQRIPLAWKSIAQGGPLAPYTYGYRWTPDLVRKTDTPDGPLMTLPEYYRLDKTDEAGPRWVPVPADQVPAETGLVTADFAPKSRMPEEPYVTPDDPNSCWKKPGPVAGPYSAHLGDGSTVIYHWYRFADQPAILNADLTDADREELQQRVEKLHAHWKPESDYLAPPQSGELAEIDPALRVTPPRGLEIGYVPIATWQGRER